MTKLRILISALVVVMPMAGACPAWAVINNNPTPGSGTGEGEAACLQWCQNHNKKQGSLDKCTLQCETYWCKGGKCGLKDEPATSVKKGSGASTGPTNPLQPKSPPAKAQ